MRTKTEYLKWLGIFVAALVLPGLAPAQDIGASDPEVIEELLPGRTYSPYVRGSFPSQVFWGETHWFTARSPNASLFGSTLGLEDAHRAARGDEVTASTRLSFKLSRPFGELASADQSAYLGFKVAVRNGAPSIFTRGWYEGIHQGHQAKAFAVQDVDLDFARSASLPKQTANVRAGFPIDASAGNHMNVSRPALAQESDVIVPPNVKTLSMGLPQTWSPEVGASFYTDNRDEGTRVYGAEVQAGLYRPILHPVAGVGLAFEAFYRVAHSVRPTGGVRLMIPVHVIGMQWGWEYDFRRKSVEGVFSFTVPLGRGGLFGQGDRLRLDWSAGAFRMGWTFPVRGRWMGTSRPESIRPSLPKAPRRYLRERPPASPPDTPISERPVDLADLRVAARWVNDFTAPFFDQWGTESFLDAVDDLKRTFGRTDRLFPDGHTFEAAIALYHSEVRRAFTRAVGGDERRGEAVTKHALGILLDKVIFPYNRFLGQRKRHDSLRGFGAIAGARFSTWLAGASGVATDRQTGTRQVFDEVVAIMEENRRVSRSRWADSRTVWIPLHYAVQVEDHDTQAEIDVLIERALEQPFTHGNEVSYVINQQFHIELRRQILEAEDYHVLWIHDFKGKNAVGDPDRIGFEFAVNVYLRALINAVEAYDVRGAMPQYFILLDQFFYASNNGARWMRLLRDPLGHSVKLPGGFKEWEQQIRDAQQELRDAVANSTRLQAGRRAHGEDWLENQVRVHVNITNPADPSFIGAGMLPFLVVLPDNMLRDHRKIAFYDVTEADPSRGESIFSGMGIAEHYVGGTWEDRAVLVRGPAILDVKRQARQVLLEQGFSEDEIPAPLKPLPMPDDYQDRVTALVAARGEFAVKAVQVHNATGYGDKWSDVARAMLYNLMPAGSTIIIPDSLWSSPLWQSMLVGSALRGGRVFVIVPSVKNSPGDSAPVISRANEIFTRFFVIQQELGEPIAAAGGVLRTGIYNVEGAFDLIEELGGLIDVYRDPEPALAAAFPFDPSLIPALESFRDELAETGYTAALMEDAVRRDPKVHLKSQILISREVVESLVPRPEVVQLVERFARRRAEQLATVEGSVRALQLEMEAAIEADFSEWWSSLSEETKDEFIVYLTVGSHNMDNRGQIMDGEVSLVVSGGGALSAYLNFVYIAGVTTWVDSVEELETMLPRANGFVRWFARWIKNAL